VGVDATTPVAGNFSFTYYTAGGGVLRGGAPVNTGAYIVVATFTSSDPNYTGGSAQTTFTISPDPTSISVSASNTTPVYGQSVTLTATVTTPAGEAIPTSSDGTVTFYDGGTKLGTVNLSGNTATLTNVMLAAGQHTIIASYSGDNNFVAIPMGQCVLPAFGLNFPEGVAVDSAGNVYIADTNNSQVVELLNNGTQVDIGYYYQFNGVQYTPTSFFRPFAVTAVGAGEALVTDGTDALVQVPLGGIPIQVGYGIVAPLGQATDSQGDLFIADAAHNQVVEYKADGSVTTVGSGLNQPSGVAVDASGDVFIADSGNNRVVEVKAGLPLTVSQATPTVAVSDASKPYNGNAFSAADSVAGVVAGVDSTPASTLEGVAPTLTYYQGTYSTLAALNTALAGGLLGSSTAPSAAGSYTVVASFAGSTDYTSGQAIATFTIGQAAPTVSVSDAGGTFNGKSFSATDSVAGVVVGVDNTAASTLEGVAPTLTYYQGTYTTLAALNTALASGLTGSSTAPTQAGSYTVVASFAGSTDYTSGQAIATFTIGQATPTVSVSDASNPYNQKPFAATDSVAGVVVGVDNTAASTLEGVAPTLTYYQGTYATLAALNTALAGGLTGSSTAPSLPGSCTVVASFAGSTDYSSRQAIAPFTIKTPTTSITGPTIGVPGQPLTYTFKVNGPTQGIVFTINYGDGTTLTTSAGGPSITLDHLYHTTNTFTIQVTAKDSNGVVSQLATQSVKISTVAMETDPSVGTALAVGGNAAGGDTILVTAANTSGTAVNVTMNKVSLGTFTPTGHILVYGQGGKDTITLQPDVVGNTSYYIEVPALLYGEGSGGDHISAAGSAANNVLTGHGNNELLTGGHGRDLLIAGTGAATLNAGSGDDILIGGSTNYDIASSSGLTYDKQLAALDAIMAEWGSAASYATRLSALAGYLSTSTVHDNYASGKAVADQLLGNTSANDWFFAGVNDTVKGKSKNAQVTSIT
jgi:hypothetical protein